MSDELVVDFGLSGIDSMVAGLKAAAAAIGESVKPMQSIARALKLADERSERFAKNMVMAALAIKSMGGSSLPKITSGGSNRKSGSTFDPDKTTRYDVSKVNAAHARMSRAAARNMPQFIIPKATPKQKLPPSLGQAVKNAIFSTRFTASNGHLHMMPLIGRTLQALSAIHPAAAAAVVGITALASVAHMAAEKLGELNSARNISGGSYAETGKVAGVANALGISPAEAAAMARSFASGLGTPGSPTQIAGAQNGIRDPFGGNPMFGQVDTAKNFLKGVQVILDAPTDEKAQRLARQFGPEMEKILDLRQMDKGLRDRLLGGLQFTAEDARAGANYRGSVALVKQEFDKLLISTAPLVRAFAEMLSVLPDVIEILKGPGINGFKSLWDWMSGKGSGKTEQQKSQDKAQQTMEEIRDGVWRMAHGLHGGGERAAGAIPSHYRGGPLQDAIQLGQFAY